MRQQKWSYWAMRQHGMSEHRWFCAVEKEGKKGVVQNDASKACKTHSFKCGDVCHLRNLEFGRSWRGTDQC